MCDFCGCPAIEPFMQLTDEHVTLLTMADAFGASGDPLDLDALRVSWEDHRTEERAALEPIAEAIGLHDALAIGRDADAAPDELLSTDEPNAGSVRRAVAGHIDAYEYEVFPQIVMAADPGEIEAAAARAAGVRAM